MCALIRMTVPKRKKILQSFEQPHAAFDSHFVCCFFQFVHVSVHKAPSLFEPEKIFNSKTMQSVTLRLFFVGFFLWLSILDGGSCCLMMTEPPPPQCIARLAKPMAFIMVTNLIVSNI